MARRSLALPLAALGSASLAAAQPVALMGGTVYDGTGGPPLTDAVVVIEAGRIACVGTAAACPLPAGAETFDATGRFVTPGLVDTHVHYSQTGWFDGRPDSRVGTDHYDYEALQQALRADPDRWHRAYLCSGVTAVFDPGGLPWTLEPEAGAEASTERPHYHAAGPLLTHYEPIFGALSALDTGTFLPMRTDEDVVAGVRHLAEMGARAVKVWYIAPPEDEAEALDARLLLIGREARGHGLPLIAHATELRTAKAALRAGAAMLVHGVFDAPVDDEFIRLAHEAGATYVPTIVVPRNWRRAYASVALGVVPPLDDPNGCVDAETRRVLADAPALQATLPAERRDPAAVFAMLENAGRESALASQNLLRVHEAGISIAAGSDAGNPLTMHGPAIYTELEAMEQAGLPAAEVLVTATRNGARLMGRLDDFGTVEPGKMADLVVLEEDPGVSTSAFRSITHVVRGGVLYGIQGFAAE